MAAATVSAVVLEQAAFGSCARECLGGLGPCDGCAEALVDGLLLRRRHRTHRARSASAAPQRRAASSGRPSAAATPPSTCRHSAQTLVAQLP